MPKTNIFTGSSMFGDLTLQVQARIDAASALNKRLFDTVVYRQFLDWDDPMIGLDFEEMIGKYNISIAAATIGENSESPIIGTEGIETLKNRVLNHSLTVPLTMTDYRKVLQLLRTNIIPDAQIKKQLINIMWGNTETAVNGVEAKIDLIFLSLLSNCGVFEFNEKNNPEGGVRGSIDMKMPKENIATANKPWTKENSDSVDPFEDIQAVLDAADDKSEIGTILLSPAKMSFLTSNKNMKKMIFGSDKSSSILTMAEINQYMEKNEYPTFQKIRRNVRIHKGNTTYRIKPWNGDNIVFVPSGKLGKVKNSYTDSELKPESDVTYSNYGRIRVSEWYVGQTKGTRHGEFTKAESLALPVITEFNDIYTLKTNGGEE